LKKLKQQLRLAFINGAKDAVTKGKYKIAYAKAIEGMLNFQKFNKEEVAAF
jgi:hypothetical protein